MDQPKENPRDWPEDFLMTRAQASQFALAHGIRIAVNTLAKLAVGGGGPPMKYFGRRPYYEVRAFRQWLLDRQRPATSTSDIGGRAPASRRRRKKH